MVRNLAAKQEVRFSPRVKTIPFRKEWLHIPVFLPGEFHEERNLKGYHARGHKESDTAERLIFWDGQVCSAIF